MPTENALLTSFFLFFFWSVIFQPFSRVSNVASSGAFTDAKVALFFPPNELKLVYINVMME